MEPISLTLDEILKDAQKLNLALSSKGFKSWSRLDSSYMKHYGEKSAAVLRDLRGYDDEKKFSYIKLRKSELKPYSKYLRGRELVADGDPQGKCSSTAFLAGAAGGFYGGCKVAFPLLVYLLPENFADNHVGIVAAAAIIPSMLLVGGAAAGAYSIYKKHQIKNYEKYKDQFDNREIYGISALEAALK